MKSYKQLIAEGEPFRLLFPLGLGLGLAGLLVWPLYGFGLMETYPGILHQRLMIQGFLAAFAFGFLTTALPRLLEVPLVGLWPSVGMSAGLLLATVLHSLSLHLAGDFVFLVILSGLLLLLATRFTQRKDMPPPAFILVLLGMLSGWFGTLIEVLAVLPAVEVAPELRRLGFLLWTQAFFLLPVLGIGSFLFPRFLAMNNRQIVEEARNPTAGWCKKARFAGFCGIVILLSFVLEAWSLLRLGSLLRGCGIVLFLGIELPYREMWKQKTRLARSLRMALASFLFGYFLIALWPDARLSLLHVVMMTGFGLVTLVVATRVVLGHSGQSHRFETSLKPVLWLAICFKVALVIRILVEFFPTLAVGLYAKSGLVMAAGFVLWGFTILPSVRKPDTE